MANKHICSKEWQIASLETNFGNVMDILNEIKTDTREIKTEIKNLRKEMYEKIADEINKVEQTKAWKWTEKILIFIWWIVWSSLVWAILSLILK